MKKIILLALAALMMVGCVYKTEAEREKAKRLSGFNTIIIDSCEYLKKSDAIGNNGYGYFAHKGNCRFCQERKQKELEKLVTKLKEK